MTKTGTLIRMAIPLLEATRPTRRLLADKAYDADSLEFVREKWKPVFPRRQTKAGKAGASLVQNEPDKLQETPIFARAR